MPRAKSFYRRLAEAGESMFFPSETKVQNSSKYKAYDCELQNCLEDLRMKHRDFIRKMHTEVLELKQFMHDVQKIKPAGPELKRIERKHKRRRLMENTETEMIKVRVDNEIVTLPILVKKKREKPENGESESHRREGHTKGKRRRSVRSDESGKHTARHRTLHDLKKGKSNMSDLTEGSVHVKTYNTLPSIDVNKTVSKTIESSVPSIPDIPMQGAPLTARDKEWTSQNLYSRKEDEDVDLAKLEKYTRPASLPELLTKERHNTMRDRR